MSDLVSIIVPVYNAAAHLPRTLDSLRAIEDIDFEAVLIDDGSTDASPAICDECAAQDSRFTVIHQENAGPSAARNAGLDAARGQWIAFVDADDVVTPGYFAMLLASAKENNVSLVVSDCAVCTPGVNSDGALREELMAKLPQQVRGELPSFGVKRLGMVSAQGSVLRSQQEIWDAFVASRIPWSLWGKLYARELWGEDVRLRNDLFIAEDLEANVFIFANPSLRLATLPECGYLYFENEGSIDHSFTRRHLTQLAVFDEVMRVIESRVMKTQVSPAVWYMERVLNCLKKANRAHAMEGEVANMITGSLAAYRAQALAHPSCDRGLRLRIRLSQMGPVGWWLLERV